MSRFLFLCLGLLLGHTYAQRLPASDFHVDRSGLSRSFQTFTLTKKGRVAFMGGSITEAGGWRDSVCAYLSARFPETNFEFINAGISSTGSTPGAFRFTRDVLSHGRVDLLFEEAAVNDPTNGFAAIYQVRGMEGIIRQALVANPDMDVIVMHCADPDKLATYQQGTVPEVIIQHERAAGHYGANSIHLAREVYERIRAGEFRWKEDFRDLHPSPFGQGVYARSICLFLTGAYARAQAGIVPPRKLPALLDASSYVLGHYVSPALAKNVNGFRYLADWKPADSAGTRKRYVSVPVLEGDTPGATLTFQFTGTAVGICITSGPDAGAVDYEIDGRIRGVRQLFTPWSHLLHLPWYVVLEDELLPGHHTLSVKISPERANRSKGHAVRIHHFLVNGPDY